MASNKDAAVAINPIRMEQNPSLIGQTVTIQKQISEKDAVMELLMKYEELYMELPENIYGYFNLMIDDKKPAVSIEIHTRNNEAVDSLKKDLEKHFFVFSERKDRGDYCFYNLSVSKIRSIAECVNSIGKDGFAGNAGVIGLLLGYNLGEVIEYVRRTGEDGIKR